MLSRNESDLRMTNRDVVRSCAALTTVCAVLASTVLTLGATDVNSVAAARAHGASSAQRRVVLLGIRQRGNPATLASQVSDPSSRWYRRFLSLRQYRSRFSPTRSDRQRVQRYLAAQPGVLKVQLSSDQSVVLVVVTVQAGQRLFCARGDGQPTRGLCTPRSLRREVREISAGEVYQASGGARDAISRRDGTSQTCAGAIKTRAFNPHQLSTAYGVDALRARGLNGSGLRVDTLSSQEVDASSFRTWARCFGLRAPVVRQFAMPGATRDTSTAPEETVLDVEALASLAPGLQRITPIFVPLDQSFSNSFLLFMFGALDPSRQGGRLPDILSISDGVCERRFTRDQLQLGERMLTQAAALGITTLSASGDLGFRGCFINEPGTMFPASSPFVTGVGGTDLRLTARNRIASQVVWSTYATQPSQGVGSGGGPSNVWRRPSFQRAPGIGLRLQRGTTSRLVPDIAAMASFSPGIAVFDKEGGDWGSAAARARPRRSRLRSSRSSPNRSEGPGARDSDRCPRFSTRSRAGATTGPPSSTSGGARARVTPGRPPGALPPAVPPSAVMTSRRGWAR